MIRLATNIINPRRDSNDGFGRNLWYPYYAGFSSRFCENAIQSAGLSPNNIVADPWNGGGTTTWAAKHLGFNAWGGDLNPAMHIVAKAKLLDAGNCASAATLARKIIGERDSDNAPDIKLDPLARWLELSVLLEFRQLERLIQQHVVPEGDRKNLFESPVVLSELSSFLYLSLFILARYLAKNYSTTNPTWISSSKGLKTRHSRLAVREKFIEIVEDLNKSAEPIGERKRQRSAVVKLAVANSSALPIETDSVGLVLSSPPYCTRIDYAVATSIELAVLGASEMQSYELRKQLMGTTTVPKEPGSVDRRWGHTCLRFIESVKTHPSYASATYYHKSHVQYFSELFSSMKEISRILTHNGSAILVVQDSLYKNVRNDLATIVKEMGESVGLRLIGRNDFAKRTTLRSLNPSSRKYGVPSSPVESVLQFSAR